MNKHADLIHAIACQIQCRGTTPMPVQIESFAGAPPLRVWLVTLLILIAIGLFLGVIALTVRDAWLFLS
jgi:hypothetical protein